MAIVTPEQKRYAAIARLEAKKHDEHEKATWEKARIDLIDFNIATVRLIYEETILGVRPEPLDIHASECEPQPSSAQECSCGKAVVPQEFQDGA